MAGPESFFDERQRSFYANVREVMQEQTKSDPEYQEKVCRELWANTPAAERANMEEAFRRDHPDAPLEVKALFYRDILLRRHLARQTVLAMELEGIWENSPDEPTGHNPVPPPGTDESPNSY